jgi:hypothetical protein
VHILQRELLGLINAGTASKGPIEYLNVTSNGAIRGSRSMRMFKTRSLRPSGECAKVRHGFCTYRDAGFNLHTDVVVVPVRSFCICSIVLLEYRTSVFPRSD